PKWLQPLHATLRAFTTAHNDNAGGGWHDDDMLARLDNEVRRCIPHYIRACGLPNHRLGVRCLWVVSKSSRVAWAISPPPPNNLSHPWRVVDECCVNLPNDDYGRDGDDAALLAMISATLLGALDVLGVVDAASLYRVENLSMVS